MKKRIRQMTGIALAFVMALILASCGSDRNGVPGNKVVNSDISGASGNVNRDSGEAARLVTIQSIKP